MGVWSQAGRWTPGVRCTTLQFLCGQGVWGIALVGTGEVFICIVPEGGEEEGALCPDDDAVHSSAPPGLPPPSCLPGGAAPTTLPPTPDSLTSLPPDLLTYRLQIVEHRRHCTDDDIRAVVERVHGLESRGLIPPWQVNRLCHSVHTYSTPTLHTYTSLLPHPTPSPGRSCRTGMYRTT